MKENGPTNYIGISEMYRLGFDEIWYMMCFICKFL